MKAAALAVALVAFRAVAAPSDAPVREIIKAGQPAPQNGCFLNDSACTATGKELAALRAENASLKTSLDDAPAPMLIVAALVLGFVGGGAAVYLVTR